MNKIISVEYKVAAFLHEDEYVVHEIPYTIIDRPVKKTVKYTSKGHMVAKPSKSKAPDKLITKM